MSRRCSASTPGPVDPGPRSAERAGELFVVEAPAAIRAAPGPVDLATGSVNGRAGGDDGATPIPDPAEPMSNPNNASATKSAPGLPRWHASTALRPTHLTIRRCALRGPAARVRRHHAERRPVAHRQMLDSFFPRNDRPWSSRSLVPGVRHPDTRAATTERSTSRRHSEVWRNALRAPYLSTSETASASPSVPTAICPATMTTGTRARAA